MNREEPLLMSGLGGIHIAEKNCRDEILNDLMLK